MATLARKDVKMVPNLNEDRMADARVAPRASLYLAAALYCDGKPASVKIRNISPAGALIEGSIVPVEGTLVQLVRGDLIVHGLVAWAHENRCGLKFSGVVDVQRWRAMPSNAEQQRVDDVVRLVKAGAVPLPVTPLARPNENGDARPVEDLRRVTQLLEGLGEALASDVDIVNRHAFELQNLDIAIQVIAALEAAITGNGDDRANEGRILGLRRSADEALRRIH